MTEPILYFKLLCTRTSQAGANLRKHVLAVLLSSMLKITIFCGTLLSVFWHTAFSIFFLHCCQMFSQLLLVKQYVKVNFPKSNFLKLRITHDDTHSGIWLVTNRSGLLHKRNGQGAQALYWGLQILTGSLSYPHLLSGEQPQLKHLC